MTTHIHTALGKLALLALLCAGCTTRTIVFPNGTSYKSARFANKETIGEITFQQGTNKLVIKSISTDQVSALGVVVDAAVSAAIKGVKP